MCINVVAANQNTNVISHFLRNDRKHSLAHKRQKGTP